MAGARKTISENAQLMAEWNWERNADYSPYIITEGSGKKLWWKCSKGHEWDASPNNRSNGCDCPVCSGRKILEGYNDLATTHAELAKEWHIEKNGQLRPTDVSAGSNKKVWWICESGHVYEAQISNRSKGRGCPRCSGKQVTKGVNDLETKYPEIAKEWHPTRNGDLTPDQISYGSSKKYWWINADGDEFEATVNNRTSKKSRKTEKKSSEKTKQSVISGVNDFQTRFPELAAEWCVEKNKSIKPNMILPHTREKYWWTCPACGVDYFAALDRRVYGGTGCPRCAARQRTSFAEQTLYYYIQKCHADACSRYKEIFENQMELDIYIPSLKVGIEYDGSFWHVSEASFVREKRKYEVCKAHGITLIRIREKASINNTMIADAIIETEVYRNKPSVLNGLISEIAKLIPLDVDYDVERDASEIKCIYYTGIGEQSLLNKFPDLAQEWDYEANGELLPSMVSSNAADIVGWKCVHGHSWTAPIYNRSKGSGCPFCARLKANAGENDIKTLHPELVKEWDYNKNNPLIPEMFLSGSSKRVGWICEKGHTWETTIYNRTKLKTGCPYCSNNLVWEGFNDLQTLHPQLAQEWNTKMNGEVTPNRILAGSTRKAWWICAEGHEWEAQIRARVRGNGCPQCKALKTSVRCRKSHDDFVKEVAMVNPNIMITGIYKNNREKIECRCMVCQNEWAANPSSLLKGHGCPRCAVERNKKYRTFRS